MKSKKDPRHRKRELAVQSLFKFSFKKQALNNSLAKTVLENKLKIDRIIRGSAPQFPIRQINKVDLAILRLAVYEMIILKSEPYRVIVDEAIELAKEYGSEKSPKFVNGALGTIIKKRKLR